MAFDYSDSKAELGYGENAGAPLLDRDCLGQTINTSMRMGTRITACEENPIQIFAAARRRTSGQPSGTMVCVTMTGQHRYQSKQYYWGCLNVAKGVALSKI